MAYYAQGLLTRWYIQPSQVVLLTLLLALWLQSVLPYWGIQLWQSLGIHGLSDAIDNLKPLDVQQRSILKLNIITTQLLSFGLLSLLISWASGNFLHELFLPMRIRPKLASITIVVVFGLIPFAYAIMIPKSMIQFPSFMSGLERALHDIEHRSTFLVKQLTQDQLLFNLLAIAVIPAIMEEFFFRGCIQNSLLRILSPQGAILLTAFFFSLMHLQIYGLFSWWLMGIVLGYLAYWSGSLFYPILAHFINNALGVFLAFYSIQFSSFIGAPQNSIRLFSFGFWVVCLLLLISLWSFRQHSCISLPHCSNR